MAIIVAVSVLACGWVAASGAAEANANQAAAQRDAFSLPAVPRVLSERVISVTVVRLTGGLTGVRADGEAVWITSRPGWEQIPPTAQSVTFTARATSPLGRRGRTSAPRTLTGAAARQLVAVINALPVVQPGVAACPAGFDQWLQLTFRAANRTTVASATEHPTGCPFVSVAVGGRSGPPLEDSPSVTSELVRLGAIPLCTRSELRATASVPTKDPTGNQITLVINQSDAVCHVAGYPRLRLFGARGHRLAVTVHHIPGSPVVPLDPGQAASASATFTRCSATRAARAGITLPGVAAAFTLRIGSRKHPFAPCHGRISIGALSPAY